MLCSLRVLHNVYCIMLCSLKVLLKEPEETEETVKLDFNNKIISVMIILLL